MIVHLLDDSLLNTNKNYFFHFLDIHYAFHKNTLNKIAHSYSPYSLLLNNILKLFDYLFLFLDQIHNRLPSLWLLLLNHLLLLLDTNEKLLDNFHCNHNLNHKNVLIYIWQDYSLHKLLFHNNVKLFDNPVLFLDHIHNIHLEHKSHHYVLRLLLLHNVKKLPLNPELHHTHFVKNKPLKIKILEILHRLLKNKVQKLFHNLGQHLSHIHKNKQDYKKQQHSLNHLLDDNMSWPLDYFVWPLVLFHTYNLTHINNQNLHILLLNGNILMLDHIFFGHNNIILLDNIDQVLILLNLIHHNDDYK